MFKMLEKEINNPEVDGLWWCPECGKRTLEEVEEDFWLCKKCGYNENRAGESTEEINYD